MRGRDALHAISNPGFSIATNIGEMTLNTGGSSSVELRYLLAQ
jgi:hypothetical protein